MAKLPKIYKALKTKLDFSDVKLNDLDYLSENSSLESYFKSNDNDLLINKLNKARGQILTEKQDLILEMRFKTLLPFSKIAKELKTSRQNITSQYYRAITKLRRAFNVNTHY